MTTVVLERSIDIRCRLTVWRERWQHAPNPHARAHAQAAIDFWLDRLLDIEIDRYEDAVPVQRPVVDLAEAVGV